MIGTTVSHYRIVEALGSGGMGIVYKAIDTRLGRPAAIKMLSGSVASGMPAANHPDQDRFIQEARACAALDHSNIGVVYDIGETASGDTFIAMAYYDGQTLAHLLRSGPLSIEQAIAITRQIADGLAHAHRAGIIHRDIKPANVVITRDGVVKIIDFGIARLAEATRNTRTGAIVGTTAYMSPEQARGGEVDARTDLWSLGVVLYEMLTAHLPFSGATEIAVLRAVLDDPPRPVAEYRADVPPRLQQVLDRALAKSASERFASAADFVAALAERPPSIEQTAPSSRRWRSWGIRAGAAIGVVVVSLVAYWAYNIQWAREQALPEVLERAAAEDYVGAFKLAVQAERYIADDPLLLRAWPQFSARATIESTPPGADVYMKPYERPDDAWEYLGKTPIATRIPRGHFRWKVEHAGYELLEQARRTGNNTSMGDDLRFAWTLQPAGTSPAGMIRVEGATVSPQLSRLDSLPPVKFGDFWIDRYEVTNTQFKAFVDAGGYRNREYWQEPFLIDGREAGWDEAMTRFRDATGRPGPAGWELGSFPEGLGDHPVSGVSWFEAAAYAQFVGKMLPTVYHWSHAAGTRTSPFVVALSNIENRHAGSTPVGRWHDLTEMGAFDMAGNVKEWCLNAGSGQARYLLGGAWNELAYQFIDPDTASPWDRLATYGFRTAKFDSSPGDAVLEPLRTVDRDLATEKPVSDEVFRIYRDQFAYDATPLNAKVESVDPSSETWTMEKVTFDAAYGGERVIAYLFLPKRANPPYQTVVLFPGANAVRDRAFNVPRFLYSFLLDTGRAVVIPIYKGTFERRGALSTPFPDTTTLYRDHVVAWAKDLGRSIDYLATRSEIDSGRLAYYGVSWGASLVQLPAIEQRRLKAAVLVAAGVFATRSLPEVDPVNFAPRLRLPVLMINGRSDFTYPPETSQEPLFRALGTEAAHKRRVVFDTNHMPVRHELMRETLDWLDKYLGPVAK
jgi:cephalosporin-C deacetylase-like acetyl esterase/predicted Ser/Thr protein kinase